jgi:hypothetical protein
MNNLRPNSKNAIYQLAQDYADSAAVDEADWFKAVEDYSAGFEAGVQFRAIEAQKLKAALIKIFHASGTHHELASKTIAEKVLKELGISQED